MKKTLLFVLVCIFAVFAVLQPVDAKKKKTTKTKTETVETVKEEVVDESKLVKVYIFEAGGCPACEAEMTYLQGLDSFNKKFIIVEKELYVDHVDWDQGKDYALGVDVVKYFNKHGFANAGYTSTPLVIISDVYAENGYNASLETVIEEAYTKGDKDIVGQIENGEIVEEKENHTGVIIAICVVLVGGIAGLAYVATHDSKKRK